MRLDKGKYRDVIRVGVVLLTYCAILMVILLNLSWFSDGVNKFLYVLQPFIFGFVIAYFLNTPWCWFQDKFSHLSCFDKHPKVNKVFSLIIIYLIALAFLVSMILFIVPQMTNSILSIIDNLPGMLDLMKDNINNFLSSHGKIGEMVLKNMPNMTGFLTDLYNIIKDSYKDWGPKVYEYVLTFTNIIKNIFLGLFISIYMLVYKNKAYIGVRRFSNALLSSKLKAGLKHIIACTDSAFKGFILTQASNSFIVGVICCIVMLLFDMPYAVLSCSIIAVCNMIPIFGQFIGAIPGAVLLLLTDVHKFWLFLLIVLCVQQFECHILTPQRVSAKISIPPIWVLFGVLVCGGVMGVIGFFIGVPLVAVIYTLFHELVDICLHNKGYDTDGNLVENKISNKRKGF